jgi:hypothetical protein
MSPPLAVGRPHTPRGLHSDAPACDWDRLESRSRPLMPMSARWRRTGLQRDECVCDARGKICRGEPVDGNYGEIWNLWASWR